MADNWKLKGDFVLSCNCTVFCPCVISLGQHEPTEGRCQGWAGIRVDEGLLKQFDEFAKRNHMTRDEFITRSFRSAVAFVD